MQSDFELRAANIKDRDGYIPELVAVRGVRAVVWFLLGSAAVALASSATLWRVPSPISGQAAPTATLPPSIGCAFSPTATPGQPPVVCRGGDLIHYPSGWNLIAGYEGLGSGTYVVGASGPLYTWQAGDIAYEPVRSQSADGITWTPLTSGLGYWGYFPEPTSVRFPVPPQPQAQTFTLPAGEWIMVGDPFSVPATATGADLLYIYKPAEGYTQVTSLQPGQGAWAYSAGGATLTFCPVQTAC